ncbi:MAG TPA: DedA family protein [Terriglobales bacterium]|nr:DedA family protein [Terriglobales bacterium]
MLAWLSLHIIAVISSLGYGGVMLLMALESACIPLPSEIILPFSGFLVSTGRFDLLAVTVAGAVGCNLGSMAAYVVGFYGGRPLAERYGRWLFMAPGDLARSEAWFHRYGDLTVLVSRMLPVVRTYIALPAGVARMPLGRFHLYTFVGSLPWCWLLAYIGYRLGTNWTEIGPYFHRFDLVWAPLLLGLFAWAFWHHFRRWKRANSDNPE